MSQADGSLLEVRDIAKRFGAVVALRSADLTVVSGEVHALLGANGAGKSTLVKVLTGVHGADAGTIHFHGREVRVGSPAHAVTFGIASVFQDPALVPDLTVGQNLRLTGVRVDDVRRQLAAMDLAADMGEPAGDVPLPLLRMIDLARALVRDPQLLILDEITAALPSDLAERVFAVMRAWRKRGRAVLFITHRLKEVIDTCDRATILRDGEDVAVLSPQHGGEAAIVAAMLGPETARAAAAVAAAPGATAEDTSPGDDRPPALRVRELRVGAVNGVSFAIQPGEILGVAALEGQGQDDLFAALSGERPPESGEIEVRGKRLRARHPYDAIRAGAVFVPADRLLALLPQRSLSENVAAPRFSSTRRWGPINIRAERRRVADAVAALQIDTRAQKQVRRLSGGNQQKVTIARWLATGFQTLLCYDPTRGIDVGTKHQIYTVMRSLADDGAAILFFSSELAEFPLVCDRVLTLFGGAVTAELRGAESGEAALLRAMHGISEGGQAEGVA
jgi:ribose transport system ATP-binding protein